MSTNSGKKLIQDIETITRSSDIVMFSLLVLIIINFISSSFLFLVPVNVLINCYVYLKLYETSLNVSS